MASVWESQSLCPFFLLERYFPPLVTDLLTRLVNVHPLLNMHLAVLVPRTFQDVLGTRLAASRQEFPSGLFNVPLDLVPRVEVVFSISPIAVADFPKAYRRTIRVACHE